MSRSAQLQNLNLRVILLSGVLYTSLFFCGAQPVPAFDPLQKARKDFDHGDYDKVLSELKTKTDVESLVLMNRALHWMDTNDDQYFSLAYRKHPEDVKAILGLGLAEMDRKQYPAASKWILKALEKTPQNAQGLAMLGVCKIRMGQESEGLKLIISATALNDSDELTLETVASGYDSLLEPALAVKWYDKLLTKYPNNPEVWVLRGKLAERMGNSPQSLSCYSKAISLNNRFESGYTHRAKYYFHRLQYDKSVIDCTKVIALNSGSSETIECLKLRASCYGFLNQQLKSIADLREYLKLTKADQKPKFFGQDDAYLDMAKSYIVLKDYAHAEMCLSVLRRLRRKGAEVLEQEAVIQTYQENYREALRDYDRLIAENGDNAAWTEARRKITEQLKQQATRR